MSNRDALQVLHFRPRPPSDRLVGGALGAVGTIVGVGGTKVAAHVNNDGDSNNDDDSKNKKSHHNLFSNAKEFILTVVPFANEMANVLAHLKDEGQGWALEWLYQHSPKGIIPSLSKYTIDFVALLSMVGNGINKFNEYLEKGAGNMVASVMGLWEASIYLIFSYIVPSFSIPATQKFLGNKFAFLNTVFGRFATGVIVGIGSLEVGVRLFSKFITPIIEDWAYKLKAKKDQTAFDNQALVESG